MFGAIKNESIDSICDKYLRRLHKLERNNKQLEGLPTILIKKSIYFDSTIINSVIEKLIIKEFILSTENKDTFFYGQKKLKKGWFVKKDKKKFFKEIIADDFLEKIEGSSNIYKLTIKGRSFVENNQYLDQIAVEDRKLLLKKIKEKSIDSIIVIIVSIITTLITIHLTKK